MKQPDMVPAECGFRMPAEWEPHAATWIAWPHQSRDWPGKFAAIPWVFAEIVRQLAEGEEVKILVKKAADFNRVKMLLYRANILGGVHLYSCPTDRAWVRDTGPLFLKDQSGTITATGWKFNAWAKYPNWTQDDLVAEFISQEVGCRVWQPHLNGRRIVLEGGSIDVDSQGLLLTTEECLLSPIQARNPGVTREELEKLFRDYLGANKVLWLNRGIEGDDTHGHIDDLARFIGPGKVVTVVEDDPGDKNHAPLRENLERLKAMCDLQGRPLEVHTLPMPGPVQFNGVRLPASYANFYIANGRVLVPTFNDRNDRRALNKLAELFPDREIVGIHAVDLVWGFGTLHCLTQQEPKGKS
jgi:agmatine deiminase